MFIGKEVALDPRLSRAEKLYIKLLGVPINGMRIRARHILPKLMGNYSKILDAGCGMGVFSFEMAKKMKTASIRSIDLNEKQIEANRQIAEKCGFNNLSFEIGDATNITGTNEYDMILSCDVIEHVEDDLSVCKGIFNALKPGGKLVMHIPAMYRRWLFFGRRLNFTHEKGHVRPGYTPEGIRQLLQTAGFKVDTVRYTYGFLETATNNIANIISRSNKQNKVLYALAFPVLLFISYWGQFKTPKDGSGVLVTAHKE